jgi:hypothetical protein
MLSLRLRKHTQFHLKEQEAPETSPYGSGGSFAAHRRRERNTTSRSL